ncbi:MAG: hypothetical protein K8S87_05215 [Planctomycetes bacterium]|nr:hypothetical protein [Planctomycetota bacterium]
MKFSISVGQASCLSILVVICVTFGCCSVPKDFILSIDDDFNAAQDKLDAIRSKPSGKGLISDMYFDEVSKRSKAWWFMLPDKTLLGINTMLQNADEAEKSKITQILLGEVGTGFTDKIRWDMQVKTHFRRLNLAEHAENSDSEQTIELEVGRDYANVLRTAKIKGCVDSKYKYDYVQNENVKYDWLQLPDKTIVQLCGFRDKGEKNLKLVEIKVCNSGALFEKKVESWYPLQSARITPMGKKLWGIDVQSSYFNIYSGMPLVDALRTVKSAKCNQIFSKVIEGLDEITILNQSSDMETLLKREFYRFQINEHTELLIFASMPIEGAFEKIDGLYAISQVPDVKTSKTIRCLVEFEFIDLVQPFMSEWFEHID